MHYLRLKQTSHIHDSNTGHNVREMNVWVTCNRWAKLYGIKLTF